MTDFDDLLDFSDVASETSSLAADLAVTNAFATDASFFPDNDLVVLINSRIDVSPFTTKSSLFDVDKSGAGSRVDDEIGSVLFFDGNEKRDRIDRFCLSKTSWADLVDDFEGNVGHGDASLRRKNLVLIATIAKRNCLMGFFTFLQADL